MGLKPAPSIAPRSSLRGGLVFLVQSTQDSFEKMAETLTRQGGEGVYERISISAIS